MRIVAVLVGALVGCGNGDANLRIDLRTDYAPTLEVRAISIQTDSGELRANVTADVSLIDGFRVGDIDLSPGPQTVRTTLLGAGDTPIARQTTQVRLDGDSAITVLITRDCGEVTCPTATAPAATACIGATCADPTCTLETPEACPVECESAADCSDPIAACAEYRCLVGSCFAAARADACGANELCNPASGCETVDGDYLDTTGLVALWSFDDPNLNDGSSVDEPIGGHTGTLSTGDADAHSIAGVRGSALRFDGVDDRVTIAAHPDFDRPSGVQKTFMGWVRRQGTFNHSTFITFNFGDVDACFLPHFLDDGTVRYWDDQGEHGATSVSIDLGRWYHYATVIDGGVVRIFWDGAEVTSAATLGTEPLTVTEVTLGWQNFDFYSHYDIDEVSVWNRVLDAEEIQHAYIAQRP